MKGKLINHAVILAAVIMAAALAYAAVPQTMNYQGYLKNADGTPVTASTGLKFSLYSSTSGANPLWSETQTVTPVNGTYSATLGATIPLNLSFDRSYYLGVTVGTDPEMRPLKQLDSVPYALRAGSVDTIGGHSHGGGDIATGTVADARLSANVVLLDAAQTVTGVKTYNPASGAVPFAVGSGKTSVVTNLNSEMVGGQKLSDLDGRYAAATLAKATNQQIALQTWNLDTSGAHLPGATNPYGMAFDGANIWVVGGNVVKKIRVTDGSLVGTYTAGTSPFGAAFDGQHIWVSNKASNSVTKFLAATGAVVGTYSLGAGAAPQGIAYDGSNIWVANSGNNTVAKLGLNGTVIGNFAVGTAPWGVISDGTDIWVSNESANTVTRLKKTDGSIAGGPYSVGTKPKSMIFDGTFVWVANYGSFNITRISRQNGAVVSFPLIARAPIGLAFDGRNLWVGDDLDHKVQVLRIVPPDSNLGNVATYDLANYPQALVFDGDHVWAALYSTRVVRLDAPAFIPALSSAAINDGAITAAKLNIDGDIKLNDKNILLRGDANHGLGWYGDGKPFSNTNLDGPALFGFSGGALGTTNGGEKIALAWDANKNITLGGDVSLAGSLDLGSAAKIQMKARDIYLASDSLHGLGWYGATKLFSNANLDGPALYGYGGGALGTTSGGQKIALSWDASRNVSTGGNLSVSGSLNLGPLSSVLLNKSDIYVSNDALHGLGWYGAGKLFSGIDINGPVLYGNGGGALGSAADSTARKVALQWHQDGSTRLNDNTLYLRGNNGDNAHGLGWFNNQTKPFMGMTAAFDGPVLYGAGGGGLGTAGNPGKMALKWDANGVTISGSLSKPAGSFKIDHPLDPKNKYLYHSFVESPDMMNIYNGVVTTDARGYATVELPAWFEVLNRDFRYQLTVIDEDDGAGFVLAKVVKGVAGNSFTIRSSAPATTVSWQVTGIRKDPYAEAHRVPVEEVKPQGELGRCLHPEACQ